QYVTLTYRGTKGGAVAGVDAQTGRVLWQYPQRDWNVTAVVPTPIVHEDHVYVTVGYGAGCDLLKLSVKGGKFQFKQEYKKRSRKTMKNEFGGVVRVGNCLYGHSDKIGWVCQDFKTGKSLWENKTALVRGSVTCADGRLYLFSDEGTAVLIEASPNGWK